MGSDFFVKSSLFSYLPLFFDVKLSFVILLFIYCVLVHKQVKKHPSKDFLTFTLIHYSSHHGTTCSCRSPYITSAATKLFCYGCIPSSFFALCLLPSSKPSLAEPRGIHVGQEFWLTPRPAFVLPKQFCSHRYQVFHFCCCSFFFYVFIYFLKKFKTMKNSTDHIYHRDEKSLLRFTFLRKLTRKCIFNYDCAFQELNQSMNYSMPFLLLIYQQYQCAIYKPLFLLEAHCARLLLNRLEKFLCYVLLQDSTNSTKQKTTRQNLPT